MRRISRAARWFLGQLVEGLRELGRFWMPMPYPVEPEPEPEPARAAPAPAFPPESGGPPAGHPERLCRDVPLTRTELMLMAEIDGLGNGAE